MRVAVTGASGFVGQQLVKELAAQNHQVTALGRLDRSDQNQTNITWKKCDLFSIDEIEACLKGQEIVYYLIHSMLPAAKLTQGNFSDFDLALADNFARAAKKCQIKQIIYLSGIIPEDAGLSRHLLSRVEVERTLKASEIPLTSLRAGIILGPLGSSFRILMNLVKRLPVMICPSWTKTLSNPISIWDVTKALTFCCNNQQTFGRYYDIGGKYTLSYIDMMKIVASKFNLKRYFLTIPFFTPGFSKLWVSTITGAPKDLVYPLVGSLKTHMVPNIHRQLKIPGHEWMSFNQSIDQIYDLKTDLDQIPNAFKYKNILKTSQVRSIQRLDTLYRFNAKEVAVMYFDWISNFYFDFIKVRAKENKVIFTFLNFKKPLLILDLDTKESTDDFIIYHIRQSLLARDNSRATLIFRNVIDYRYTITEIHNFEPTLPWYIYKYTQALVHLFTVRSFSRYLLNKRRCSFKEL